MSAAAITANASSAFARTRFLALWGAVWLALLVAGTALLMRYEFTAGSTAAAPAQWPAATQLRRLPGQATLIMFAHPKCPCTRASLQELAELLAGNPGRVAAQVVFLKAGNTAGDWSQTESWRMAAAIPGVTVSSDNAGAEAARFGSETSGDVLLYDAGGRLAFHGGITAARGEFGANAGCATLATLLAGSQTAPTLPTHAPVFGCPLQAPAGASRCIP